MIAPFLQEAMPGLGPAQYAQFERYYELLIAWNARMNLTAITEPMDVAYKHFLDSLAAAEHIPEGAACVDVGTGAGFPGIPLAILRPDLSMTLLDSLGKRVKFLEAVAAELNLPLNCVHIRAEEAGKNPAHRERYDIALSRAVAPLNVLLELTVPLLKVGGLAIAYKGPAVAEEPWESAGKALGCTLAIKTAPVIRGEERRLAIAKKTVPTPARYPRKPGEPGRKPL